MLELYNEDMVCVLGEAANVKISHQINGDYTLDFDYPQNVEKSECIKENFTVKCEGQKYRIIKISKESGGREIMHVSCLHIFHADLKNHHIQTFGGTSQTIGADPTSVMALALGGTGFEVIGERELNEMGMTAVGADGFLIDFEVVDKTTPYDIIEQIITNCGKGEMYIDNKRCALVERIGNDRGVRLDISHNMQSVTVERDISNMITRLYPYGKDDAHIGSVNGGRQYIDSENAAIYGIKSGYKDYSDYTDPTAILNHALWEFDRDNADRIDMPDINITGKIIDLSKLSDGDVFSISLGDKVHVTDGKETFEERIIKIEYYPYEPLETTVSIGRVRKDLFFYLNQMGHLARRYNRNSTSNGKVSAQAIAGTITAQKSGSVSSSSGTLSAQISDASLKIMNGQRLKCRIGNSSGSFVLEVYDNRPTPIKALEISSGGLIVNAYSIKADSIMIGDVSLTSDSNGNLYANGKKILTEEVQTNELA